ncbi:oxidoreductase [Paractinoplanes atraurantiacus]|uniref:Uncharacterized protein n=1 Tax=Paractinoplanes atraurantiacus TaxID=1036182 RepID=A0A285I5X7_9ACTN|nr:oxidoreductase [Actinoplanes atraurantiacus]SNY42476.1 hypothetical protein SAMN05421748_106295 [Actinoplanes atraurantiacus]
MTAAAVAAGLALIAGLDGALAGFRSSCGRSGLVRHRAQNVTAHLRGLAVVLLAPVAVIVLLGYTARPGPYLAAGRAMLAVYVPFAVVALLALVAYLVLGWRRRFLTTALVLGPCTAARPLIALLAIRRWYAALTPVSAPE